MGTITYFDQEVRDALSGELIDIDIGTTGIDGEGSKIYLKLGGSEVLFSHDEARRFINAVADIARYQGYDRS